MEYWIVGKNGYFIESIRGGGVIEFTPHEHLAKRFYDFGEAMEFFKFGYQVIKRKSNVVDADPKRMRRNQANTAEQDSEEECDSSHAYNSERKERTKMRKIKKKSIITVAVIIVVLIVFAMFVKIIPDGNVGVVVRLGAARNNCVNPGPYIKLPIDSVHTMSTQEQTYAFDFVAFSSDMQQVSGRATIFYALDKDYAVNMYKTVGKNYENKLLAPNANEAIKNVIGHYNAEKLVDQRGQMSDGVKDELGAALSVYGLRVNNIAIENMDFSDAFEAAIEAKQVATQEKLKAQTQQEQQTIVAKAEAERAKITAEAEAAKVMIAAQAEADAVKVAADAEAYRLQQEAMYITDATIQKETIQKWNGVLPVTFGGGVAPILDVSDILNTAE